MEFFPTPEKFLRQNFLQQSPESVGTAFFEITGRHNCPRKSLRFVAFFTSKAGGKLLLNFLDFNRFP